MIKITPRLIVQGAVAVAAIARLVQAVHAENKPALPRAKAPVLPITKKRRPK